MYCPECRSEYNPGIIACKDCRVELVPELPPEPTLEYVDYEDILSTHSPSDRAIIRSILEAEDIPYYFQGEYVSAYVMQAIPVRLMVKKDQVARAVEALKDLDLSFSIAGTNRTIADQEKEDQ
jgi:hypothetical protein